MNPRNPHKKEDKPKTVMCYAYITETVLKRTEPFEVACDEFGDPDIDDALEGAYDVYNETVEVYESDVSEVLKDDGGVVYER